MVIYRMGLIALAMIASANIAAAQNSQPDSNKPATAASPDPSPADSGTSMENALPGDHWTYEVKDEITGDLKLTTTNIVTDVSATELNVRTGAVGSAGNGNLVYDHAWNVKDTGTWKFSPNDGSGIKLPLKAGSTWSFRGSDILAGRTLWKRSGTSKVVGEESVTTKAGTFNTFKIETSITVSGANDPTKKVQVATTLWYAPAIDHWVKRTSKTQTNGHVRESSSLELVEYGRQ
ncbi:MAG TPA: hypothetical protein VI251_12285 [Pseudolabrys sp.]|jgi:hypothetical protein